MGSNAVHPYGVFCWPELASSHPSRAAAFYSALFDWTAVDRPGIRSYTVFQLDGVDVAAVSAIDPQAGPSRPVWNSYVSVADARDAAARASELGARIIREPAEVPGLGRLATLEDPTGAILGLREMTPQFSARMPNVPGALCWTELTTGNVGAAEAFYVALFDWRSRRRLRDNYIEFLRGSEPVAGVLASTPGWRDVRPHWMPYFAVPDVDDVVDLACRQGGAMLVAPESIPMAGRFGVLRDAEGAEFGVYGVNEAA